MRMKFCTDACFYEMLCLEINFDLNSAPFSQMWFLLPHSFFIPFFILFWKTIFLVFRFHQEGLCHSWIANGSYYCYNSLVCISVRVFPSYFLSIFSGYFFFWRKTWFDLIWLLIWFSEVLINSCFKIDWFLSYLWKT